MPLSGRYTCAGTLPYNRNVPVAAHIPLRFGEAFPYIISRTRNRVA